MLSISKRRQFVIGIALLGLMAATRGQHIATLTALPDASWAIFLIAGVLLASPWWLAALLGGALLTDMVVWNTTMSANFCITAAYGFLLPAYGSLWLGGRWLRQRLSGHLGDLPRFVVAILGGTAACELFSSGGFYFFSGRFTDTSLAGFAARFVEYFPGSLSAMTFYATIAAVLYAAFTILQPTNLAQGEHRHSH